MPSFHARLFRAAKKDHLPSKAVVAVAHPHRLVAVADDLADEHEAFALVEGNVLHAVLHRLEQIALALLAALVIRAGRSEENHEASFGRIRRLIGQNRTRDEKEDSQKDTKHGHVLSCAGGSLCHGTESAR